MTGRNGLDMFGFLKQRAAESAQNKLSREQAHEIYTRVMIRAAKAGKLSTTDEKELERVATILGKLDDIESELAELAAGFLAIKMADEWDAAKKAQDVYMDEMHKVGREMQARYAARLAAVQAELDAESAAYEKKFDAGYQTFKARSEACYNARKTAREFRIKFHVQLGIESPLDVEARNRPPIVMARDATAITGWNPSSPC